MRFARNLRIIGSLGQGDANQRRHGRLHMQDIRCSLGTLLDLSASGMRLKARGTIPKTGQIFTVTLQSVDGPVLVGCRIRWWRKCGMITKEVGVEFVDPTPAICADLGRLAQRAAHNESVRQEIIDGRTRE